MRRETAAIEQQNHLPPFSQRRLHRLMQRPTDRPARRLAVNLVPQIDRPHRRHRPIEHPPRHLDQLELAALRPLPTLERRRRARQHQRHILIHRPPQCHVAGMIPRRRFLLERRFMFFIEHDNAQVRRRCEHRALRADDHLDLAVRNPPPMLVPLDVALMAMQHRHAIEPRPEPADRLRCQTDFRHEQNRLPTKSHHFLDRPDINFRLAAPRNTMDQDRAMLGRMQRLANRASATTLLRVQFMRRLALDDCLFQLANPQPLDRLRN